jgi:hypothetical protein
MATSPLDPRLAAMLGSGQAPQGPGAPPSPPAAGMGMGGDPTLPPTAGAQTPPAAGGNPTDQVIWQAFPSTDPNAVSQLRQQATLRMVLDQLVGPSPDQAQAPAAGPGVTGPGYQ